MNAALLYRPRERWRLWCAFGCAVALHLAGIALAANRSPEPPSAEMGDRDFEVIAIGEELQQPPDPIEVPPTPPPPVITQDDDSFPDEDLTPTPVQPPSVRPARPITRRAGIGQAPRTSGSIKVLALSAPRPEYPYEARRQRTTGTGVASLMVDFERGNVVEVRMVQSTGSPILDRATTAGLRRWRFKQRTVTTVAVPITFTLTGAIY